MLIDNDTTKSLIEGQESVKSDQRKIECNDIAETRNINQESQLP